MIEAFAMYSINTDSDEKKHLVKALYNYTPANDDELELKTCDVIEVVEEVEEGWWKGVLKGSIGMFPSNFVKELVTVKNCAHTISEEESHIKSSDENQKESVAIQSCLSSLHSKEVQVSSRHSKVVSTAEIEEVCHAASSEKSKTDAKGQIVAVPKASAPQLPPKPVKEQARVMYPYEAQNEDELTLRVGDVITIISKEVEDKGWWKGELGGQIGVFPENFAVLLKAEDILPKKPNRPNKPAFPSLSKQCGTYFNCSEKQHIHNPPLEKTALNDSSTKPSPPDFCKRDSFMFDALESSSVKLIHLTARRAKAPNKRPPSHNFFKGNRSSFCGEKKRTDASTGSSNVQNDVVNVKAEHNGFQALQISPCSPVESPVLVTSKSVSCNIKGGSPDFCKDSSTVEKEHMTLEEELAQMKRTMVCKAEYENLADQVNRLKQRFEDYESDFKKLICHLKDELDAERKKRIAAETEIERIKQFL